MKRLAIAAVGLALLGVMTLGCKDDEVSLSENIKQARADPTMQANLSEFRSEWEDCVKNLGKVECLASFLKAREESLGACLDEYDPDGELCRLNLEVVAEEHGWSIPTRERTVGLLRSDEESEWERSCIENVDPFNCLTRHVVYLEEAFDVCDDLWGGDACEDVLGDLMAGLTFETERQEEATEAPVVTVSPTAIPASPVAQGLPSDRDNTGFEVFNTAHLWSSASDLLIQLDGLISPDGQGSQRAAVWYAFELDFNCCSAENDSPALWNRVAGACDEIDSVDPAGLMGLVDSERYDEALALTQAVEHAAAQHLLELAHIEEPTYELLTTASLTAHASSLGLELEDLTSPQGDSTPLAAILLSSDVAVDCEMAEDGCPDLWTKVSDEWYEVEEAMQEILAPVIKAFRDAAEKYPVSREERKRANDVYRQLLEALKLLARQDGQKGEGDGEVMTPAVDEAGRSEPHDRNGHRPEPLGGTRAPTKVSTPAPPEPVGTLRRLVQRLEKSGGLPPIRPKPLDKALRSGRDVENGAEVIVVNTKHPMYIELDGDAAYMAETAILEMLRPDDESESINASDYYGQALQLLNAWYKVVEGES